MCYTFCMRINARLDQAHDKQLTYLCKATKSSVTEVVKHSIELYYEEIQKTLVQDNSRLLKSGFIGCASGEPNLSSRYKELLHKSLSNKYGYR